MKKIDTMHKVIEKNLQEIVRQYRDSNINPVGAAKWSKISDQQAYRRVIKFLIGQLISPSCTA